MNTPTKWITAIALVPLAVASCGDLDGVENSQQDLTQDPTVYVGKGITRAMHRVCSTKCVVSHRGPKGTTICDRRADDCATPVDISLHADEAARARGETFPADNTGPQVYVGCGPQAAKNVLAWYGINMSIYDVASRVEHITFSDSQIATTPDDLARDLGTILNAYGDGHFTVQRKSSVDVRWEVRNALNHGNPILVLVQDGNHWQMVTRLEAWTYTLIDYPWSGNHIVDFESGLGISIGWPGLFVYGYEGYESNTVITINRS
jgi:hypothetical protein